jgi:dihydroorotase
MNDRILITGATIVNEGRSFEGSVLIENERIAGIFPKGREDETFLDLENVLLVDGRKKLLLPGVIDDHVHFREPGFPDKGDLYSESSAAVAGGVTSFMDMPNTNPKATTLAILEEKFTLARQKSLANYSFYLGATNDNLAEIEKADPARICGLKLFLGSSTGNMLVDDDAILEKIFAKSRLLIAVHSEDEEIIKNNLQACREKYGDAIPFSMHPVIRSADACYKSTLKAVTLAGKHKARMHILHLSTEKELSLFDNKLPLAEKKITAEVCLPHLWFDDRDYEMLGPKIKLNPAVKSEKDREALFAGMLENRVDVVATDHAPHLMAEKDKPYLESSSGAPFVQHSLVAMLEFRRQGKISLEKVVEKMCHSPATVYRIRNRGFIREGYFADLVMVDPASSWTVDRSNLLYKCGWSPLEGQKFSSRVTHTFVNGHLAYSNGNFDETRKGKRMEFDFKK